MFVCVTLTSDHRAGGGKGVVQQPRCAPGQGINPELRTQMFFDYGDLLSSLNGCYGRLQDPNITHESCYIICCNALSYVAVFFVPKLLL